jgi:hypothetical protein
MKEQFKQAAKEIGIQIVVLACSKVIEIISSAPVNAPTKELPSATQSK